MKEHFFNAKIHLTPDIVMTLCKNERTNINREGTLLLFRMDKEKTLNEEKVKEIVNKKCNNVTVSDMNLGKGIVNIGGKLRDEILENKFNQIKKHKLVITDRLHGMIFAAITETPCIAFGNFNHKISESYKWFENLKYIQFCNEIDNLEESIDELNKLTKNDIKYDNTFAKKIILEVLQKEINN